MTSHVEHLPQVTLDDARTLLAAGETLLDTALSPVSDSYPVADGEGPLGEHGEPQPGEPVPWRPGQFLFKQSLFTPSQTWVAPG